MNVVQIHPFYIFLTGLQDVLLLILAKKILDILETHLMSRAESFKICNDYCKRFHKQTKKNQYCFFFKAKVILMLKERVLK